MRNSLKIGSKVSFLHSTGRGVIKEILNQKYLVEDEFGFDNWHSAEELVPLMQVSDKELFASTSNKEGESPKKDKLFSKPPKEEWKIDLHLENLLDSHREMTNHEIVTLQLRYFKNFLQKARNARIPQFIVVHGKGTGKLKSEIQNLVRDIKGAEMFDADYMQGASIIEQKYNIR
ncbi:hypothetical protein N8328_05280 [Crocinitomicaceae bacterium]|jgi:hypothetical protein|nr:hypothetical protein [Crocinitomicaceae bacterium]